MIERPQVSCPGFGKAQPKRTALAGTVQVRACSRAVFYGKATRFLKRGRWPQGRKGGGLSSHREYCGYWFTTLMDKSSWDACIAGWFTGSRLPVFRGDWSGGCARRLMVRAVIICGRTYWRGVMLLMLAGTW
jgi:hypothetical protein